MSRTIIGRSDKIPSVHTALSKTASSTEQTEWHSEADVKAALKSFLRTIGAYPYWPVPVRGSRTIDCFFCFQGRFFAVETKRSDVDEPTAAQDEVLCQIAKAHGGTCVENDVNLPNVKRMLSAIFSGT